MDIDYATNVPFKIEGWLKIAFVITTLLYLPIANYKYFQLALAAAICILGLKRQMKTFPLTMETLRTISLNEFGNGLFYILFLLTVTEPSMAFYLPLDLYFLIGISEFVVRAQPPLLTRFAQVKGASEVIKSFKDLIKVSRTFCEVFLFFYVVIMAILGKINFIAPIMSFNYLRLKGASKLGRWALLEMQKEVTAYTGRLPIVAKVVNFFFNLLTSY